MFDYTATPSLSTELCQPETLHAAWRKVRGNKGGPGSDGVTIQQFEANLTKHLHQLSRELTEERYYPLPLQKFTINKSNGSTREPLCTDAERSDCATRRLRSHRPNLRGEVS